MRVNLEVICVEDSDEVANVVEWGELQDFCNVDMLVHDNRITFTSLYFTHYRLADPESEEGLKERECWMQFVTAFHREFGC